MLHLPAAQTRQLPGQALQALGCMKMLALCVLLPGIRCSTYTAAFCTHQHACQHFCWSSGQAWVQVEAAALLLGFEAASLCRGTPAVACGVAVWLAAAKTCHAL